MSVLSLPWYYLPDLKTQQSRAFLETEEWHHAFHVLRMQPGDHLLLFDGSGTSIEGNILTASKLRGEIELLEDHSALFAKEDSVSVNIAFAPTKNIDRTEFAVEKLVELGVNSIRFLETTNSERTHIRMDRIEKIVIAAAKQSRKLFLPLLSGMQSIEEVIQNFKEENADSSRILCMHLDEECGNLQDNYHQEKNVLLLIGPEGGFTDEEVMQMKSFGASSTTLGPYRLRVETAVIAACANIHLLHSLK